MFLEYHLFNTKVHNYFKMKNTITINSRGSSSGPEKVQRANKNDFIHLVKLLKLFRCDNQEIKRQHAARFQLTEFNVIEDKFFPCFARRLLYTSLCRLTFSTSASILSLLRLSVSNSLCASVTCSSSNEQNHSQFRKGLGVSHRI